ncbi:MAG: hydrogenase formation protein HypD [Thermodesulfobacteriota bacterium]
MDIFSSAEFRDPEIAGRLVREIRKINARGISLMEVCGTHTMAIFRTGIRSLLPDSIRLVSGPGCPVCVTSQREIDTFVALAGMKDVIITTFGDLIRVPGSRSSLQKERAEGRDIRVVYSIVDAIDIARKNPDKKVIFLGVGFETTAPTIAAGLIMAKEMKLDNFYAACAHKRVPPALKALLKSPSMNIDGFLLPGHVSVIIGEEAYRSMVETHRIPCVITGFEPTDILQGILALVIQINSGQARLENAYSRAVLPQGNPRAMKMLYQVFESEDAEWRGIGVIQNSGLRIRNEYREFDALRYFDVFVDESTEPKGCSCGQVLTGTITPLQCPLFRSVCTPEEPVGPCMVSTEGTCAAYYRFSTDQGR